MSDVVSNVLTNTVSVIVDIAAVLMLPERREMNAITSPSDSLSNGVLIVSK